MSVHASISFSFIVCIRVCVSDAICSHENLLRGGVDNTNRIKNIGKESKVQKEKKTKKTRKSAHRTEYFAILSVHCPRFY